MPFFTINNNNVIFVHKLLCSSLIIFFSLFFSDYRVIYFYRKLPFFFLLFRAIPMAYGNSQARGRIGATATGLHHSQSHTGSEPHLQPTPQLMTMPDP